jgi:hypothetical protein
MNCEQVVRRISDYVDRDLDDALLVPLEQHVSHCNNCRVVLDTTREVIVLCREIGQDTVIPRDRNQNLYQRLLAALPGVGGGAD